MKIGSLLLLAALLGLPIFAYDTANAYHLHHLDGSVAELQATDSLVSVLFADAILAFDSSAFARERPELQDDAPVKNLGRGIYIFAVEPGLAGSTVQGQLRTDARVRMANPVLGDGEGHVRFMSDQLIVQFKDGTSQMKIDSLNSALAAYVNPPDPDEPLLYFVQARSDFGVSALDVAEMYYETGLCRYAQPDFIWQPVLEQSIRSITVPDTVGPPPLPPDTLYSFQWHWNNRQQAGGRLDADIDADSAWLVTKGDGLVRVALLDHGFDIHHEDVDSLSRVFGYDPIGPDMWNPQPDSDPYLYCSVDPEICGHGTSCLGELAAAHGNYKGLKGLAPHCTYWAIKDGDDNSWTRDSTIRLALRSTWALLGCQIVSNSWSIAAGYDAVIEVQLDTMYKSGIAVFFSAGNSGYVKYPAWSQWVTAVGATNPSDSVWTWSGKGDSLDIVAPGGDLDDTQRYGHIWTEDMTGAAGYVPFFVPSATCANSTDYMCKFGGTSSAAPIAAGVAALVLSRRTDFIDSPNRVEIIRRVLEESAERRPTGGWNSTYGHGRVNAYRALLSIIRGDFDNSGRIDTVDARGMERYCFRFGSQPTLDRRVGDTDCDGDADIFDFLKTVDAALAGTAIPPCFNY